MNKHLKASIRKILPKQFRPHRILSGPLSGMRIVTSWNDYPSAIVGLNERPLLRWFDQNVKAGETWLDIGGHYGYTTLAMSRLVGQAGRVFTFEPTLSTAGFLSRTVQINGLSQVTVVPMGLGSPPTLELVRIATSRGMSDSTLKRAGENEVTILVASFDWLWPQLSGTNGRIDGVKIDVQGMELEVLRGMGTWLRAWKPKLAVEVHLGVDREALLGMLDSFGYSRDSKPIDPVAGEITSGYHDDHSYAFQAR
jgi:FkbM family methyltransferase